MGGEDGSSHSPSFLPEDPSSQPCPGHPVTPHYKANLHSYRADWPHPCFPLKSHKKWKVILFLTHRNTKTDRKGATRTANETLLADRRLASVAGTRGDPVPACSTEFQEGSEVTQGLLTVGRRHKTSAKAVQ